MRDELTPLMIFLTTDFDYRCAKLGTIFTEKRDLTDDEITKVSFSSQSLLNTDTSADTDITLGPAFYFGHLSVNFCNRLVNKR